MESSYKRHFNTGLAEIIIVPGISDLLRLFDSSNPLPPPIFADLGRSTSRQPSFPRIQLCSLHLKSPQLLHLTHLSTSAKPLSIHPPRLQGTSQHPDAFFPADKLNLHSTTIGAYASLELPASVIQGSMTTFSAAKCLCIATPLACNDI